MICHECGKKCKCVDSRPRADGSIKRRYRCSNGHRFGTTEFAPSVYDMMQQELKALQGIREATRRIIYLGGFE